MLDLKPPAKSTPEFLIEITSPSDSLKQQQDKCEKWIAAGVKEAVLLHPKEKSAYVYRSDRSVEMIQPAEKIASQVLKGFVIDCSPVFEEL